MYKILMIDDDPTSLAIGKALLGEDFDLSLAHSGQQALGTLIGDALPDLILLDMVMPGINGMGLLQRFKDDDRLRDIPVIMLTGETDTQLMLESYDKGAADFLSKPVDPNLLRLKINQQLRCLELARENAALKAGLRGLQAGFLGAFGPYLGGADREGRPSPQ